MNWFILGLVWIVQMCYQFHMKHLSSCFCLKLRRSYDLDPIFLHGKNSLLSPLDVILVVPTSSVALCEPPSFSDSTCPASVGMCVCDFKNFLWLLKCLCFYLVDYFRNRMGLPDGQFLDITKIVCVNFSVLSIYKYTHLSSYDHEL